MKRNYFVIFLIMLIFIIISFVTNISGSLLPDIQTSLNLSLALVTLIPSLLLWAYGFSIPIGMLAERYNIKTMLLVSLILAFLGCFLFAIEPTYAMALLSLFTIGVGFSLAQVIINPLLRVAGGEKHYAFFSNMSQMVFAASSAVSPQLFAYLTTHLKDPTLPQNFFIALLNKVVTPGMPWISLYWVFALMIFLILLLISFAKLPPLVLNESEKVGSLDTIKYLFTKSTVWIYFVGILCYVATENGVSNLISLFLQKYHNVDPTRAAQISVSGFWGAMAIGCAVSLILLKLYDSRKILFVFMTCGIITLLLSLFGTRDMALIGLPMMGFWCSVGWPIVFSLALNSLEKHHGSFAGVLCTGIIGGGIMLPLIGELGDMFGLRIGMLVICLSIGYLIFISLWAKPLVNNETINSKKKDSQTL